jgi:L-serine dehydratase
MFKRKRRRTDSRCLGMGAFSVFNHVIGPVMRGPSSSHTAASYRIAAAARQLLGGQPAFASFSFDRSGSYGQVYREQGGDTAFAAGLLGLPIEDDRYPAALKEARANGLEICFNVVDIPEADHPNTVLVSLKSKTGDNLELGARSIGGGMFEVTAVDGLPVRIKGEAYDILVLAEAAASERVMNRLSGASATGKPVGREASGGKVLLHAAADSPWAEAFLRKIRTIPGVDRVRTTFPAFYVRRGGPLLSGVEEIVSIAEERGWSLGRLALSHETGLLGMTEAEARAEMERRYEVMKSAVARGLAGGDSLPPMRLLGPSAGTIFSAEARGALPVGGMHARAAARAMAALHVNCGGGVVCAAPTGGSSGVLPGVLVTLEEEKGIGRERIVDALFAAGAVGLVILARGTFAAEEAGCQVEIGAAGAMAAAAVVEAAGGTARQAADAAAVSLQNTIGWVCDLVQGVVEIPCHTRNAVAASSAFVCADLVLGGYANPIPLEETVDASMQVGRSLKSEFRCTARGGLAATPAARAMKKRAR